MFGCFYRGDHEGQWWCSGKLKIGEAVEIKRQVHQQVIAVVTLFQWMSGCSCLSGPVRHHKGWTSIR